jgi:hypothetical protein
MILERSGVDLHGRNLPIGRYVRTSTVQQSCRHDCMSAARHPLRTCSFRLQNLQTEDIRLKRGTENEELKEEVKIGGK